MLDQVQEYIDKWKKQYEEIYQIQIGDEEGELSLDFIFRVLGREEYKQLLSFQDSYGRLQERICETAILYPFHFDFANGLAGIAECLSNYILEYSGITEDFFQMVNIYDQEMLIIDYQIDCIIHEAFPHIPFEEISSWSLKKTAYFYSRAKWILRNLRGLNIPEYTPNTNDSSHPNLNRQVPYQQPNIQQQNVQTSNPEELEVLNMLAENEAKQNRAINQPIQNINEELFPELGWFKHEEELKGDFD